MTDLAAVAANLYRRAVLWSYLAALYRHEAYIGPEAERDAKEAYRRAEVCRRLAERMRERTEAS
ncbi:MAG: hypothetical protein KJ977_05330 [Candidatus Omnitrophica bacterium]|nr:hypothetical protein [Candidatus Omnitrophota bacterium]